MANVPTLREQKLQALLKTRMPRALELCSGCGGMALGLKAGGFQISAHLEIDPIAAASYARNFAPVNRQETWSRSRDMVSCSPESLLEDFRLNGNVQGAFDILAAGLPCQAFARIGRSKLRSVVGDEDAFGRIQGQPCISVSWSL